MSDCGYYDFRDARVFEPERTGGGTVEFLIDEAKLLSGLGGPGGLEFLREMCWKRTLKTPGYENALAGWMPVREIAGGVGHCLLGTELYIERQDT